MFDLFKKKVEVHILDEDEINERIDEGIFKGHHSAYFYNAKLSKDAEKKLAEQNISVKYRDVDGIPAFEIFWK